MTTLILGCSYTDVDQAVWHDTLFDDYRVYSKGGVDNAWIARTGVHALLNNLEFNNVFVMFTGIDRCSITLPNNNLPDNYYFNFPIGYDQGPIGSVHLLQSGGVLGKWNSLQQPYKQLFKQQYTAEDKNYFSQLNMYHVLSFVSFLTAQKIDFKYTFIYNVLESNFHDYLLGVCQDTVYWDALDKTNYIPITPFEFGIENNYMHEDGFHLTHSGQLAWAEEVKKYL